MKKIRYGYLNRGSGLTVINGWKLYDEPLPRIQFGFFGTLKTTDEIGELTWGNEEPHHKRGFSREELFAWLHDNIGMWCWGDTQIREIEGVGR